MGADGLTASSSVPDQAVPRLRASGGKAVPEAKMKEAIEEPTPKARPRKKAAVEPAVSSDDPAVDTAQPSSAEGSAVAETVLAPAAPAAPEVPQTPAASNGAAATATPTAPP